jgi:hypothetical protein
MFILLRIGTKDWRFKLLYLGRYVTKLKL